MALININDLSFGYDGSEEEVFSHLTLGIDTTWRLALAGRNGRGKTTFLKILKGELSFSGTVTGVPETICFPLDDLTDAEDWKIRKELNLMDADPDIMWRPIETLSGGERTKLMLAHLFASEGKYPLIDEPTNHLDRQGRESVAKYLAQKDGFIMISHDRSFLDRCTDHTLVITKTGAELTASTFSVWWDNNEKLLSGQKVRNEQLKKEISGIEDAVKKNARWASRAEANKNRSKAPSKVAQNHWMRAYEAEKSRKLQSLASNLQRRNERKIEEKSSLLTNLEKEERLKITGSTHPNKTPIELNDVTIKRDGLPIRSGINLQVHQGLKISVSGNNGCGKSTLLKYLAEKGEDEGITAEGKIYKASGIRFSYVGQDTSSLKGTIYEIAGRRGVDKTQLSTILIKMGFTKQMLDRDVDELSLGQKKIVMIALSLCEQADIYIWDEPLNYIDVYIRKEIERLIGDSDITMIFVEHDQAFTDNIADEILYL